MVKFIVLSVAVSFIGLYREPQMGCLEYRSVVWVLEGVRYIWPKSGVCVCVLFVTIVL